MPGDEVLDALDELLAAIERADDRARLIRERADAISALRAMRFSYTEIVPLEEQPLIVELIGQTIAELHEASGRFRRTEARALHAQGVTMERIAVLFGVTRQRVSTLLREDDRGRNVQRMRSAV